MQAKPTECKRWKRESLGWKIQQWKLKKTLNTSIKENTKTKNVIKQNVQEMWDTKKRPNLRITGPKEGEEYQLKGTENI